MKQNTHLVSLVIPVYNESGHLSEFLKTIDGLKLPIPKELIFIDDASKDESLDIIQKFKFKSKVKILQQVPNQGKGAAIRRGFEEASGTIIGVQDADFEYDSSDIAKLLQPFLEEKADIVFGSRFKKENPQVHRAFHYLVNKFLTMMSNLLSGLWLTDMETCYKFFKREIIQNINLESNRFGFEPEVTAKIARLKAKILEFPISYFPRNYMEGKKITWKDGVAALRHIIYYNLFLNKKKFFKSGMPEKYIPKGTQWL